MAHLHQYNVTTAWTGDRSTGTSAYSAYDRDHEITIAGKPALHCSSDPAFRGDRSRHNPEDLLLAALSGCHMLWYLHLCTVNGVIVTAYVDEASGTMKENEDGSGQFTEVILRPKVAVKESSMAEKAGALHHKANEMCFIARSVNFPVQHVPTIVVEHEGQLNARR